MTRKRKHRVEDNEKRVLYLNTPIKHLSDDSIGLAAYVDNISEALDSGAQTIAVTSSFGMGKTSVVELLREKRKCRCKERIIKVPMWTQLFNSDEVKKTIDLHKSFVYQIATQIDKRRGAYVIRRLSSNYHLYKIHTNKRRNWILILLSFFFFACSSIIRYFDSLLTSVLPVIKNYENVLSAGCFLISTILFTIAIARSEILFSNGKGEKRTIESDEVIDLYFNEILCYRSKLIQLLRCLFRHRHPYNRHFIIVIEDLDRSNKKEAVITFLQEIRKYYVPSLDDPSNKYKFKNKVSLIVNVMPESIINNASDKDDNLYDKLFDYVISIPKINNDDYETILESLLCKKRDEILRLGLSRKERLTEIPGMQWIIRKPKVGMREVKERLNRTFLLYSSLKERFPNHKVRFDCCAVVAYITTAFERDFNKTSDDAFQRIVDFGIRKKFNIEINDPYCQKILDECSHEYCIEIINLVNSGLIDGNYRTYFYNYPINSRMLTTEESSIRDVLLYFKEIEDIDRIVQIVEESKSDIINYSFDKLKRLQLSPPAAVFNSDKLYTAMIKNSFDFALGWMEKRDYTVEATERTIEEIVKVLHFDSGRIVYNSKRANSFSSIWLKNFNANQLFSLRTKLCSEFPKEALWYEQLFLGHRIISKEEFDCLPLDIGIKLIDTNNASFSKKEVGYVIDSYFRQNDKKAVRENVDAFLLLIAAKPNGLNYATNIVEYMTKDERIKESLEAIVIKAIQEADKSGKSSNELVQKYKELLSAASSNGLTAQSFRMICNLKTFDGYSADVAKVLDRSGFYFEGTMIKLRLHNEIDLESDDVFKAIRDNRNWLLENKDYFALLREKVAAAKKETIIKYCFLFDLDCPIINESVFNKVFSSNPFEIQLLEVIVPQKLVTSNEVEFLSKLFNCERRTPTQSYQILLFISKLEIDVAGESFKSLDFNNVRYSNMSIQHRNEIKKAFSSILGLDKPQNKVWFMSTTRCLDSDYETSISTLLDNDKALASEYIKAIGKAFERSITQTTLKLIEMINPLCAFPDKVNEKLYGNKYYKQYVISKTLLEKRFQPESGERGTILWPEYLAVFKGNTIKEVTDYMANNIIFLERVMSEGDFSAMDRHSRMILSKVYQTSKSLKDIFAGYDDSFVIDYLSHISGFADEEASITFLALLKEKPVILKADAVYNNTHEKLISSMLKARYTRMRK